MSGKVMSPYYISLNQETLNCAFSPVIFGHSINTLWNKIDLSKIYSSKRNFTSTELGATKSLGDYKVSWVL